MADSCCGGRGGVVARWIGGTTLPLQSLAVMACGWAGAVWWWFTFRFESQAPLGDLWEAVDRRGAIGNRKR